jgi:hypothetical protein
MDGKINALIRIYKKKKKKKTNTAFCPLKSQPKQNAMNQYASTAFYN